MALTMHRTAVPGGVLVKLTGVLDETFNRKDLASARGSLVIDLDDVRRITSFGVREWMAALKDLSTDYVAFVKCRPAVVAQFNMIANFGGGGQVISIYLPYLCPACGTEHEELVDLRHRYDVVSAGPPDMPCPKCGALAEFDDIPQSYFSFVASRPPPAPPAIAQQLIDGTVAKSVERFSARKEIDGELTALWLSGPLDKTVRLKRLLDGVEGLVLVAAGGVAAVTPEGVDAFLTATKEAELKFYLGRVPLALMRAFASGGRDDMKGRIVSVVGSTACAECGGPATAELGPPELASRPGSEPTAARCAVCDKITPIKWRNEDLVTARRLAAKAVPPLLTDYLSRRPGSHPPEASVEPSSSTGVSFEKYEVLHRIGSGGMAEIFLARQKGVQGFQKKVVLKRILPSLSEDPRFLDMFLQEAKLAARISHPNVVQIFDLGSDAGRYFIAMEYVRGWDLRNVLRACERRGIQMPLEYACRIAIDLCAGLHAAHTCVDDEGRPLGIVHRDVSPRNVLLSSEGTVKITDFGIAKAEGSLPHTKPGTIKGKVAYMAPEQIVTNDAALDARADIFAAGVVFFECVTGRRPFQRETDFDTMRSLLSDPVPDLAELRADVPPSWDVVVGRALARSLDKRYPSALAFQIDLERLLDELGQTVSARHLATWLDMLFESETNSSIAPNSASFTPSPKSVPSRAVEETGPTDPTGTYRERIETKQEALVQLVHPDRDDDND